VRWTVLVPTKSLPEAKSRLLGSSDPESHARLVAAIRADTTAAARSARGVGRLVLVIDRADSGTGGSGDEVLVQSAPGLNAALREGAAFAAERWPDDGVAALVGDLPALRPDELADALEHAARTPRGYVADAPGTGTTLLTTRDAATLEPAFGDGSAARHGATAALLPAGAGLRHDVDTPADLSRALELGVGPATLAATATRLLEVRPDSA
jgi:2-phospho-L-lactate guanylyltransferase